jgi:hypothetical protein
VNLALPRVWRRLRLRWRRPPKGPGSMLALVLHGIRGCRSIYAQRFVLHGFRVGLDVSICFILHVVAVLLTWSSPWSIRVRGERSATSAVSSYGERCWPVGHRFLPPLAFQGLGCGVLGWCKRQNHEPQRRLHKVGSRLLCDPLRPTRRAPNKFRILFRSLIF